MAKKFLTLNIGAANIELAEYEQSGKSLTLLNYGTVPLAAPLDGGNAETILAPALLELVRSRGFKPGPVAVSLSGQMVFPKFAAIPVAGATGDKFEQMVRYEIEQGIPFPIDEMVCDRQVLGETENGDTGVMIVAAKVDQVESIMAAVQSVGFQPELVGVAPLALVNAIRFASDDPDSCMVALDIGAKTTSLVIAEGDKVYTRSIPVAGNAVTKEIANALGCTSEEAEQYKLNQAYVSLGGVTEDEDEATDRMAKACRAVMTRLNAEISRSINFYRSQQKGSAPVRLYLTGGTALLPQIDQFFAEQLGIEVAFFNPFERVRLGRGIDPESVGADGAFIAATVGLALQEIGLAYFAINLLPPSIVEAKAEKAKIPFLVIGGAGLVLSLVLVALAFGNEAKVIEAQRDAVQAKVDQLSGFDKKITAAKTALEATTADAEALRGLLASRTAAVQQLNAVRTSLLNGMWISAWNGSRVTIRYWKDRVKPPAGKTSGEAVVDKLKTKAVVVPDSVRIADMSPVGTDGSIEQFTVEVKFQ